MRLPITSFFLIVVVLLSGMLTASAQSPYSFPWCSKSVITGAIRCRYTSWEECHSRTGIGGICHRSPYRLAPPDVPVTSRRRRSA